MSLYLVAKKANQGDPCLVIHDPETEIVTICKGKLNGTDNEDMPTLWPGGSFEYGTPGTLSRNENWEKFIQVKHEIIWGE